MNFKNKIYASEEEIFADLHHFLLRKNNRILNNEQVVEKTGIPHELIHKWVKSGKLNKAIFPNLGAPCERCGKITNYSRLCHECSSMLTIK